MPDEYQRRVFAARAAGKGASGRGQVVDLS